LDLKNDTQKIKTLEKLKQQAQKMWKEIRNNQYKEIKNQNFNGYEDINSSNNKNDQSRSRLEDPTQQADIENEGNDSNIIEGSASGEKNKLTTRASSGESSRPVPFLGWGNILQRQDMHKQGFRVADREKQVHRANHLVERMKSEMGKMPVERNKGGLEMSFQ
jgi:hypothetical protein